MAMGVAGHFSNEPDSLGTMRTRDTTLEFRINPRRSTADGREVEPFAGPLAILVDPLSASTSEIFAGGLQALGRARVFGRTSAGAALPAQMRRLPSGDGMMFAFADYTLPNGRSLEGEGVMPDEPSGATSEAWREGHDPDLRAATLWISRTLRDRDCHE
jgi:carboxyl-terminal processing protease